MSVQYSNDVSLMSVFFAMPSISTYASYSSESSSLLCVCMLGLAGSGDGDGMVVSVRTRSVVLVCVVHYLLLLRMECPRQSVSSCSVDTGIFGFRTSIEFDLLALVISIRVKVLKQRPTVFARRLDSVFTLA